MEKLFEGEYKLMEVLWDAGAVNSTHLVELCREKLGWNKSTTYTVLRRLCDRGLFQNEKSQVTSLVSREEFHRQQSRSFVQEAFGGSLPSFLTAFMGGRKLTQAQAEELRDLIDHYEEE